MILEVSVESTIQFTNYIFFTTFQSFNMFPLSLLFVGKLEQNNFDKKRFSWLISFGVKIKAKAGKTIDIISIIVDGLRMKVKVKFKKAINRRHWSSSASRQWRWNIALRAKRAKNKNIFMNMLNECFGFQFAFVCYLLFSLLNGKQELTTDTWVLFSPN